jgi:hypothetical protein
MPKEKTLIPNRQIELMFFRIASDAEVGKYIELGGQLRDVTWDAKMGFISAE